MEEGNISERGHIRSKIKGLLTTLKMEGLHRGVQVGVCQEVCKRVPSDVWRGTEKYVAGHKTVCRGLQRGAWKGTWRVHRGVWMGAWMGFYEYSLSI